MSYMNCRVQRVGLRVALLWGILGLILLLPATVRAGSHTVKVPPPNGVDDTANIQAALNACVAYGPGCTVKLAAGKYLTKQVVVYNFQGTFKGMGIDSTTIEALPNLPVHWLDQTVASCQPNLTTCLWPSLFVFADGSIRVSDLTLKVTAVPATQPWVDDGGITYTMLFDVLAFIGQNPTYVTINRIRMEGQPSLLSTDDGGYNVTNGVHYTGALPRSSAPFDYYFLSGSFTVQSSFFDNLYVAVSQDAFSKSSRVTIGGSPTTGNHVEGGCGGLDMEASENSVVEISYNESSGNCAGMWVVPAYVPFVPSSPSWYFIHDNKFVGTEQNADGMYLYDDATSPWIQAAVWNNTARVKDILSEGIGVYYTKGTAVWNNIVMGSGGYDGIGLWSTTFDTVANNNVSNFTVDPTSGLAQIYLDPSTTNDLVLCAERSDTVLNQGTNNAIIGCQQSTASAEAATSAARPNLLRKKPPLRK
ncbi:MAG TPA: hypothetical protein VKH18_17135 [Terriglobales bacterium]|nr:hypothetical protein [Terriglobales bacterium]